MAAKLGQVLRPQVKGLWFGRACRAQIQQQQPRRNESSLSTTYAPASSYLPLSAPHKHNSDDRESASSTGISPTRSLDLSSFLRIQYSIPSPPAPVTRDDKYGIVHAAHTANIKQLLIALTNASGDEDYIRSIPPTAWTSMLETVGRERWSMLPFHKRQGSLGTRTLRLLHYDFDARKQSLLDLLHLMTQIRRLAVCAMSILDYKTLLRINSGLGNPTACRLIWEILHEDGFLPDADCYDYMVKAIVFDEDSRSSGVQPFQSLVHSEHCDDMHFIDQWKKWPNEAYEEVRNLYAKLKAQDIQANVSTECAMMVALARIAKVHDALDILAKRWHLNLPVLIGSAAPPQERDVEPVKPLIPPPDKSVLSAIVEVLGSRNQIPSAVRLIRYFSDRYKIEVSTNHWSVLMQWAYLHARAEARIRRREGRALEANNDVPDLFEVMTSPPYNVKPTLQMIHIVFKTNKSRRLLGTQEFVTPVLMASAMTLYELESTRRASSLLERDQRFRPGIVRHSARYQKRFQRHDLLRRVKHHYLKSWVHEIINLRVKDLKTLTSQERDLANDWHARGLPNFILRWSEFARDWEHYHTGTGFIELHVNDRKTNLRRAAHRQRRSTRVGIPFYDLTKEREPWKRERGSRFRRLRSPARQVHQSSGKVTPAAYKHLQGS